MTTQWRVMEIQLPLVGNGPGAEKLEASGVHHYLDEFCGQGKEKEGMDLEPRGEKQRRCVQSYILQEYRGEVLSE